MSGEFVWRKKELHGLKSVVYANRNSSHRDVCIRCAIALLYAHWEGFISRIGLMYVEFVARQKLQHDALASNFLALAAARVINNASASRKSKLKVDVVDFFRDAALDRSKIPMRSGVNTKANLNAETLQDVLVSLGLDYSPFQTKEKLIDEKLLKNRNQVAHGKYLLVGYDEYMNLHDDVFAMMDDFYHQVEDAAVHGKFKR